MSQEGAETTDQKLDRILDQQAALFNQGKGIAQNTIDDQELRRLVIDMKESQDLYVSENTKAHVELSKSFTSISKLVNGNGKVGLAEEVRVLKRGYHAILWLGGVVATGIVIQTMIAIRELVMMHKAS